MGEEYHEGFSKKGVNISADRKGGSKYFIKAIRWRAPPSTKAVQHALWASNHEPSLTYTGKSILRAL